MEKIPGSLLPLYETLPRVFHERLVYCGGFLGVVHLTY